MSADYLFQTDKCYDCTYDTGDKVIQCGRHNDIFKLWLQWRARVSRVTSLSSVRSGYDPVTVIRECLGLRSRSTI